MRCLTLLFSLLFAYHFVLAQNQQDIYKRAIDEINCITIKTLLTSYDRPIAARMIQTCSYDNVTRAIEKVQENTIKGYKSLILETAQAINGYKNKVENPAEYSLYESALEEAQTLALRRYEEVCSKNKGANNSVCMQMEQKALKLQSELNGIVGAALPKIAKSTYKAPNSTAAPVEAQATETANSDNNNNINNEVPHEEYANNASPASTNSSGTGTSIWSMISAVIMLALIAAVAWLFKENNELKEKMDDINMLLKMLNQKK